MVYIFDGSLEGLLCAVFEWFERKPGTVVLTTERLHHPDAFMPEFKVIGDPAKAERVWKGLQARLPAAWLRSCYCCFLSERPDAFTALFEFCCYIFSNPPGAEKNYGNAHVLSVAQYAKKVEREKHRMEAFIRFQQTADDLFYCAIDPDFNVLPLIMKHFKDRYADQKWVIYDLKRHYGLYYDLDTVEEIHINSEDRKNFEKPVGAVLSGGETLYADLWKDYFNSTNIKARKNTKLHVQHVPRRYWRYLTEKW